MSENKGYSIYDNGQRKYLSLKERLRFYAVVTTLCERKKLFLLMLMYSGARISEVLNLESHQIHYDEKMVLIISLKKRTSKKNRPVPLPKDYLKTLKVYAKNLTSTRLWSFSRSTASRYIQNVMQQAQIQGIQACAKGLRHTFGVRAVLDSVPISTIKNWMGHESIKTTEIYLNVVGDEERQLYEKMWKKHNC